jgi:large subunit ribosomal protein L17
MRHGNTGRRLGRTTSHREAMFRNLVTSFLNHEKITTTDAKAKEIRSVAEKMITLGKRGDLHSLRLAASYIREKSVVTKLFTTIAPRYKDRSGGYTRIVKLGNRQGDAAAVSIIELVEEEMKPKKVRQKSSSAIIAPKSVASVTLAVQEPTVETIVGSADVSESLAE